jgi:pSer/pThr/pTyr-binding forkhead associated (FHA) protein
MADLILEIVEGDDAGRQTPLTGSIEIGREASLALPLDDEQTSRRHARVEAQGDHAVLEDLGSTNGTYLNGQPIEGQRTLRPGDRLRVGLTVFELRTSADVQRQPSAVIPVPQLTQLSGDVLEPVPERELMPNPVAAGDPVAAGEPTAAAEPGAGPAQGGSPPAFAVDPTTPGFVPQEVAGDEEAREDYAAVARLLDRSVKRQTNIATFALLAASGLAVIIVFGIIK